MIRPQEIERIRDLNSPQADAMVDLCRPRVLVVAKAPTGSYSNDASPETVFTYRFSDGLGASGLLRGDILRLRLFGHYASDTGGVNTDAIFEVIVGGTATNRIVVNRADLGGDVIAFDADIMLRFDGGETTTLNSPLKAPSTKAYGVTNLRFGDTATSVYSRSQAVADSWITVTDVVGTSVNLAVPLSVSVTYEGTIGGLLTIYGGTMEGM